METYDKAKILYFSFMKLKKGVKEYELKACLIKPDRKKGRAIDAKQGTD